MPYLSLPGLDVDTEQIVGTEAVTKNKTRVHLNGGHSCVVNVDAETLGREVADSYRARGELSPFIQLQGGEIYRARLYVGTASTDLKRTPTKVLLGDGRELRVKSQSQEVSWRQEAWEIRNSGSRWSGLRSALLRRIDVPVRLPFSDRGVMALDYLRQRGSNLAVSVTGGRRTLAGRGAQARNSFFRQLGRQAYVMRYGMVGGYIPPSAIPRLRLPRLRRHRGTEGVGR